MAAKKNHETIPGQIDKYIIEKNIKEYKIII